ncbi:ATP-dependent helicase HrpB, partial [Rhizobiaceae sp. 2RAB30]
ATLAVLLTERGLGGDSADLERRLARFRTEKSPRAVAARQLAERLARQAGGGGPRALQTSSAGALLLQAWPDRVAKARGERGRFVLANGRGAMVDAADPLAGEDFLVVADLQGKAQ